MRARRHVLALLAAAGILPAAVGSVRALTDPASGFAIDPPPPFTVEVIASRPQVLEIGVVSTTGLPAVAGNSRTLCKLRYQPADHRPEKITQDWLNGRNEDEDWRKAKRREFMPALTIIEEASVEVSGVRGVEYVAIPKAGPNPDQVRVHLSVFETIKGRLTQTCATPLTGFDAARAAFGQIRSSISLPK